MRVFIIFIFCIWNLNAKDYYVSQEGNNANSGSKSRPLQTIFRAIALANKAGDNIIILKGVYTPPFTINLPNPGAKGKMITIKAAKGEKVVIDGRNLKADMSLISVNTSYIRVEGLEVRNATACGIVAYGAGARVNNIEIINNILHSNFKNGFLASSRTQKDPARDILVEGNKIYNNSLMNKTRALKQAWAGGLTSGVARNVTFKNNEVYQNYGEGVGGFLADKMIIENNIIYDNFSVNLYLDNTTNSIVNRNLVYSTNDSRFFRFKQPANGIQIANETYPLKNQAINNIITNNIVLDTQVGFYMASYQEGGGFINSVFANNTIGRSLKASITIDNDDGHKNSIIANNIFFQTGNTRNEDIRCRPNQIKFRNNFWAGQQPSRIGKGTGDKSGNPNFIKPTGVNPEGYKIKASSKARNAGSSQIKNPIDFNGNKRTGKIDIGAWEFE